MQGIDDRKSITHELIEIIQKTDVINRLNITPKEVRIGIFYTGIVLNSGHAGMSYTPAQEIPEAVCCPKSHAKMPAAGTLLNLHISDLMNYALEENALKAAVGIATINALSAILLEEEECEYKPSAFGNALDLVRVTDQDTVVMVGAFPPFIKQIQETTKRLFVIEKNPRIVGKGENIEIEPVARLEELIPQANILIITGVTLINQTLGPILRLARNTNDIIVVGPTASVYPKPLFDRGVTIMGGVRIADASKMIHLIGEAGSGYDFFENCAEKIIIRNTIHPTS